jgi:hypothetical protein
MRTILWLGLALALAVSLTWSSAHAQQGGRGYLPRVSVTQQAPAGDPSASGGVAREDRDLFSPYSSRAAGGSPRRPYNVARPRVEPPATEARTRNYYPGLRPGQGPNRNTVRTDRLCVPGRRAFSYR